MAGHGAEPYGRSVDTQIGRLRRKIEPDPKTPRFILTVSGAGYKFAAGPRTIDGNRNTPAPLEPGERLEAEPTQRNGTGLTGTAAGHGSGSSLPHSGSERRQVTVLSCDYVGSTASAINGDPEDFAHIVESFQNACAGIIADAGGSIAGFAGQELLALFGYPKAHEDDAERAVRAGLDLVAKMGELSSPSGEPLQVRIGIATGLVVVADQRAGCFDYRAPLAEHRTTKLV